MLWYQKTINKQKTESINFYMVTKHLDTSMAQEKANFKVQVEKQEDKIAQKKKPLFFL